MADTVQRSTKQRLLRAWRSFEKQLQNRTVKTGQEEVFIKQARDKGSVKLIDIVRAKLDTRADCYLAEIPSLAIKDALIEDNLVDDHERMLTDGFYAEITLEYDSVIAQEKNGKPFRVSSLRPIQMSKSDILDVLRRGRSQYSTSEWIDFLIRSIGLEPTELSERAKYVVLLRIVPFVERNYNMVELGPRGTGKSHLFQQISPYSHLISGGKATVAKMFGEQRQRSAWALFANTMSCALMKCLASLSTRRMASTS